MRPDRLEKVDKSDMPEAAHTNALRIMAAFELNRRWSGSGVDVFCCHPGVSKTEVRALDSRRYHGRASVLRCPSMASLAHKLQMRRARAVQSTRLRRTLCLLLPHSTMFVLITGHSPLDLLAF